MSPSETLSAVAQFSQTEQTQFWLQPHLWLSDLSVPWSSLLQEYKTHSGSLDGLTDNNLSCDRVPPVTFPLTMQWIGLLLLLLCCFAACVSAMTREYFLKIQEVSWNYAPTGTNVIQNRTVQDDEYVKTISIQFSLLWLQDLR